MRKSLSILGLCVLALTAASVGTKVFTPLMVLTDQNGSTAPEVRFQGVNGKYLGWKGTLNPTSTCSWSLPAADGKGGQVLTTDGSCNTSWTWSAGSPVISVFGRSGPVVATNGDYSFPQLSGNIAVAQMNGGLNASA